MLSDAGLGSISFFKSQFKIIPQFLLLKDLERTEWELGMDFKNSRKKNSKKGIDLNPVCV